MKHLSDWLLAVATVLLVIATYRLYEATDHLVVVEKEHGVVDANKAAVDSLFRLQSVMDSTPNTRECMRYVMSVSEQQYPRREDNDYLHDLMNKNQPVPIFNQGPLTAKLDACLGGLFVQHPELADRPKDEFKTKLSDVARTYIRQQIVNFANVLDVASSFLLLDKRFIKTPDQIEKDFSNGEARFDPAYLVWKELRSVMDEDSRKFFLSWHQGSNEPLFQEFPMCRLVAKSEGEDCGL